MTRHRRNRKLLLALAFACLFSGLPDILTFPTPLSVVASELHTYQADIYNKKTGKWIYGDTVQAESISQATKLFKERYSDTETYTVNFLQEKK